MTIHTPCNNRAVSYSLMLAAAVLPPAFAQEPDITLAPDGDHYELGSAFAALGDLNADGIEDYAVADRSGMVNGGFSSGIVHLVSGVDGAFIRSYTGIPAQSQSFGSALAAFDANGDGIQDLAVGAPGHADAVGFGAGAVHVYSGADGSVLFTVNGASLSQFGAELAMAGDQNADGVSDLYVGAPNAYGAMGAMYVVSGEDGSILREVVSVDPVSSFAGRLATMGDVDGDGLDDVAVSSASFQVSYNQVGKVSLIGSSDGAVIAEIQGSGFYERLGESIASVPDADGDGLADLLVGSYSGGTALLVSGADLSVIVDLSLVDLPAYSLVGVGGAVDFDSDGTKDWLIGSTGLGSVDGVVVGGVRIVSGADQSVLFERLATQSYTWLGQVLEVLPGIGFAAGEVYLRDPISSGSGFAYLWKVEESAPDSDGDGIPDDEDANPNSILDESVVLLGIDSGVPNGVDETGVSLADRFAELGDVSEYKRGSQYSTAVLKLTRDLRKQGLITQREAVEIHLAAVHGVIEIRSADRRARLEELKSSLGPSMIRSLRKR